MNRCEGLMRGRLKNGLPAIVLLAGLVGSSCIAQPVPPPDVESIRLDPGAPVTPFPHFWEKMFGSGRAVLALRESYRRDLETVRSATDFTVCGTRLHAQEACRRAGVASFLV